MSIRQITIVGTGLIGGSLGLALKPAGFCRRPSSAATSPCVLQIAQKRVAPSIAARPICALAVRQRRDRPRHAGRLHPRRDWKKSLQLCPAGTLITDAGSTKQQIAERPARLFGAEPPRACCPDIPWPARSSAASRTPMPILFRGRRVADHAHRRRSAAHRTPAGIPRLARIHRRARRRRSMPSGTTGCAPGSAICRR